jgi:hypothetical protein
MGAAGDAAATDRICEFCHAPLVGKRADAKYCTSSCRTEASRLRRLLAGSPSGGYANPRARLDALRKGRGSRA